VTYHFAIPANLFNPPIQNLTAIDGISVDRFEQLLAYIQEHKSVGDNISFSLLRNGQTLDRME
jgi:hypothetical protein